MRDTYQINKRPSTAAAALEKRINPRWDALTRGR